MMNAFAVTSDLAADNSVGVRILDGSAYTVNTTFLIQLNFQCAGGWAIMRAGTIENRLIHVSWSAKD
ncbi:uncharacterized protein METZ01_LOCUS91527 [marine metagenome]|jgi:hypothetical protein|uniref:Uncharacterized protein n=1 Tax=marine metagenome TaxID=408172 RepID=A0A381VGX1_9ZZZZ